MKERRCFLCLIIVLFLLTNIALCQTTDTDGDGLSDFQEIHKYFTNPTNPDTDEDGISDGNWDEKREYTYTIRSVLRFMPPFDMDLLNDNFQDARILKIECNYIEVEVIHYPFATAENSITANPNWQLDYAGMTEYLQPSITTNWNYQMKQDLLSELQADGIVIDELTDRQAIEQVSYWMYRKYNSLNSFTTFYIHCPNNEPEIYPGLEAAFDRDKGPYGWTTQEQFEHEVLGKGMYYNKTRGTCTSFATALTTVLRTIGIPTRMILVIPIVDASNPNQTQLVEQGITNKQVRQITLNWLSRAGSGFTSHTFNEVYVGNQWHRLNYTKLGQPILDESCFGLHTHLYTFNDLSDAYLAGTWGWRYGKGIRNDIFGYSNPYTTISLSDLTGEHVTTPTGEPTIYVDDNSVSDPGPMNPLISDPLEDGSFLHPYDSIQEAIDMAADGNTIVIQPGRYSGSGNCDIDFKGLAITVQSTEPSNHDIVTATIIDCQGNELEHHRGFYFHSSESSDSVLDGLTIINGYVSGSWPNDSGGGIFCYSANPTIKNCIINNNNASNRGGGLNGYKSNSIVINCRFNNNSSGNLGGSSNGAWGGAVYLQSNGMEFIQCIFAKNYATTYGGAITAYDCDISFTNCTFYNNRADSSGGAMRIYNSSSTIKNSILWNDTPNEFYIGGASPTISYSNVKGGYIGTGNINLNPCFVSVNNNDYHLQWNSPCINAGNPTLTFEPDEKDIDGEPRVMLERVDIGVDEVGEKQTDLTRDGIIDHKDIEVFSQQWLSNSTDDNWCGLYDFHTDNQIDFSDWAKLANNWLWQASWYNP